MGYAYNSTVENVKLTATEGQENSITANVLNYEGTNMAPNMVAGIVGARMDSTIKDCTVRECQNDRYRPDSGQWLGCQCA